MPPPKKKVLIRGHLRCDNISILQNLCALIDGFSDVASFTVCSTYGLTYNKLSFDHTGFNVVRCGVSNFSIFEIDTTKPLNTSDEILESMKKVTTCSSPYSCVCHQKFSVCASKFIHAVKSIKNNNKGSIDLEYTSDTVLFSGTNEFGFRVNTTINQLDHDCPMIFDLSKPELCPTYFALFKSDKLKAITSTFSTIKLADPVVSISVLTHINLSVISFNLQENDDNSTTTCDIVTACTQINVSQSASPTYKPKKYNLDRLTKAINAYSSVSDYVKLGLFDKESGPIMLSTVVGKGTKDFDASLFIASKLDADDQIDLTEIEYDDYFGDVIYDNTSPEEEVQPDDEDGLSDTEKFERKIEKEISFESSPKKKKKREAETDDVLPKKKRKRKQEAETDDILPKKKRKRKLLLQQEDEEEEIDDDVLLQDKKKTQVKINNFFH